MAWLRVALAAVILMVLAWRAGALATLAGRWRWVVAYAVAEGMRESAQRPAQARRWPGWTGPPSSPG